jgi:hypothetical protein
VSKAAIRVMACGWLILSALCLGTFSKAQPPAQQEPDQAPDAEKKVEKPADDAGPGPEPIPQIQLVNTLPTVPVKKSEISGFNVQLVDNKVLPSDIAANRHKKDGIWVLDFAYKPLRLRTVEVPGKGTRIIHYLYYRVINHTGAPRPFIPQFTLITDTGKRYEEAVIPTAVNPIKLREAPEVKLIGAVDIDGMIPESNRKNVDDAVFGVAMFEGIDPKADALHIYVRGLSDGHKDIAKQGSEKPTTTYKTIRLDFIRRGDHIDLKEREIQPSDPPYEWIYW